MGLQWPFLSPASSGHRSPPEAPEKLAGVGCSQSGPCPAASRQGAGRGQAGSGHACWGGGLQPPNRAAKCCASSTLSHGTLAGCSGGGGEEKPPRLKVNVKTKQSRDGNASAAAPMQTAPALWQPSPDKGVSGSVPTLPSFSLWRCSPFLGTVTPGRARASVQPHQCPFPRLHTCVQSSTHVCRRALDWDLCQHRRWE